MIISNLNECCYKCAQPDLEIETNAYESFDCEVFEKNQVIKCSHSKVCKYYLEEEAKRAAVEEKLNEKNMIELINTNTSKERLDELIRNITSRLDNISKYWEANTKDMECGEYKEYVSFCKVLDDTRAFLILYRENIAEQLKEQEGEENGKK